MVTTSVGVLRRSRVVRTCGVSVTFVSGPVTMAGMLSRRLITLMTLGTMMELLVRMTRLMWSHLSLVKKNRSRWSTRRATVLPKGLSILRLQSLGRLFRCPVSDVLLNERVQCCTTLLASRPLLKIRLCAQTACRPSSMTSAATAVLILISVTIVLSDIDSRLVTSWKVPLTVKVLMLMIPVVSLLVLSVVMWTLMPLACEVVSSMPTSLSSPGVGLSILKLRSILLSGHGTHRPVLDLTRPLRLLLDRLVGTATIPATMVELVIVAVVIPDSTFVWVMVCPTVRLMVLILMTPPLIIVPGGSGLSVQRLTWHCDLIRSNRNSPIVAASTLMLTSGVRDVSNRFMISVSFLWSRALACF